MRHHVLLSVCAVLLAAGIASAAGAQGRVVKSDPYAIKPPTQQQLRDAREWMIVMGKNALAGAPKLRRIETPYFYLYSAFENKEDDKRYRDTAERMFAELCKQFGVNPKAVWIGKCPIIAFNETRQYVAFCKTIGFGEDRAEKSAGVTLIRSDGMVCIVLNNVQTETHFFHTMVHEGTHGFMARFVTMRNLPAWVNEGIAEHMSARLVPDSPARALWQEATKLVLANERKPESIFDGVNLDAFDYGMAHALVRHMIDKNGKAFSQFVRLLKQGESEAAALKASYRMDRSALLRDWHANAQKALDDAEKEQEREQEKARLAADKELEKSRQAAERENARNAAKAKAQVGEK
jgi:hypothetical protein